MGWKSTRKITREEAISAIIKVIMTCNDEELEYIMGDLFGDDTSRPYWGCNFWIVNDNEV